MTPGDFPERPYSLSTDGNWMAYPMQGHSGKPFEGTDGRVIGIKDPRSGCESLPAGGYRDHSGEEKIEAIQFSVDATRVASCPASEIQLWNRQSGETLGTLFILKKGLLWYHRNLS